MSSSYIITGSELLFPLPKQSLGELLFNNFIKCEIEYEALINVLTGERIFYKEFFEETCKIAIALKQFNLKQNDVISIYSENSLYYLQPIIGAFYLGIITATINSLYTTQDILHVLSISKPKIIFCSYVCASKILEITHQAPYIKKIIILDSNNNVKNTESLIDFTKNISAQTFNCFRKNILLKGIDINNQVGLIMCSSGTTGLPKGVMITHKNIIVRLQQLRDPKFQLPPTNENSLSFLPLSHASGLLLSLGDLFYSKRILLIPKFEEKLYLETIQKYKIADFWIVPTIAMFLSKSPLVDKYNLSCIKEICCSGSILKKDIQELIKKRLKIPNVRQGYGLTEATLGVIVMPTQDYRPGSVGKVVPRMMAKVVDPETKELLGPNKCGELLFKGDLVMKGYKDNPLATANAIDQYGWLYSGDIGYYDEDEYFYVIGRIKELIKYKGHQVPPAELENILLSHPKIEDAGVVGIPDEIAGELPMAFVVKQNATLTEKEVQDFVAAQVSPIKYLRGGVKFVKQLPRSSLDKLSRKDLQKMMQEYLAKL